MSITQDQVRYRCRDCRLDLTKTVSAMRKLADSKYDGKALFEHTCPNCGLGRTIRFGPPQYDDDNRPAPAIPFEHVK